MLGSFRDYYREKDKLSKHEVPVNFDDFNKGKRVESAEHATCREEAIKTVQHALEEMSERDHQILLRYYGYGEKLVDIAQDLKLPEDQISTYRNRAVKRFMNMLENGVELLILISSKDIAKQKRIPKIEY
jgi:RNA polymerase sigma factor (sigma-70 family)